MKLQAVPLERLVESPRNPRRSFDQGRLDELATSLKTYGLLEPLIVRPRAKTRRAAKRIGWKTWVSAEPLLGPITSPDWDHSENMGHVERLAIGGESGPGARPCAPRRAAGARRRTVSPDFAIGTSG